MNINYDINSPTLRFDNLPDGVLRAEDVFNDKRVVVFGLPGAFTPTCSSKEVYCTSVNDGFTMKAWFEKLNVKNLKFLADGSGQFARRIGMLVHKDNLGFGVRSWRYAAVINNGVIEIFLPEDGICDNCDTDPYEQSTPENLINQL